MNDEKKTGKKDEGVRFDFGFGGLLKGLTGLMEAASNLAEKGQEINKSGEFDLGSFDKLKGLKDLKAVYGVRVHTMADGRPSVQEFGNLRKTPKGPVVEEVREPIVDVFETPEEIQVIVEMPGVEEKDIAVEIKGDILSVHAEGAQRKYHKETLLPRQVSQQALTWGFRNGILEITIRG